MDSLLNFLYLGSTPLDLARMDEFLNLAETLSITEIGKSLGIECTKTDVVEPKKDEDNEMRTHNSEHIKSLNNLDKFEEIEVDKIDKNEEKDNSNKQTIDQFSCRSPVDRKTNTNRNELANQRIRQLSLVELPDPSESPQ